MSMKSLKVTILMPIYKVEQYLEKTLTSVFTQTYNNIDYVFVNDCSPDNSLKVLTDTKALTCRLHLRSEADLSSSDLLK